MTFCSSKIESVKILNNSFAYDGAIPFILYGRLTRHEYSKPRGRSDLSDVKVDTGNQHHSNFVLPQSKMYDETTQFVVRIV